MTKSKHRWWHFLFGKEYKSETMYEDATMHTSNYWTVCKKCGEQISETGGVTTFSLPPIKVRIKK